MSNEKQITLDRLRDLSEYHGKALEDLVDQKDICPKVDSARLINQKLGALRIIHDLISEIKGAKQ